jgi:hypothetical protein
MPPVLSRRRLNRATLARQLLLAREDLTVTATVGRLAGLQAQEPKPPFGGLWSRVAGFRREDLVRALHARDVVRATLMRGTLHLVTADDYVAWREPAQEVLAQGLRVLGARADGIDVVALLATARELLADGPLTFGQLRPLLQAAYPEIDERALGFAVRMHLPLVMVPTEHRWGFPSVAQFTPAEGWLGRSPDGGGAAAMVLRYLAAFGPASVADAQTWSGLPGLAGAMERLDLERFTDERGRTLYDLPDAPRPEEDTPAPVRFLPEFDNLLLAHDDRTRVIADEHRGAVATKNLRIRATFTWDGFVAGTWRVERKRGAATLELAPFQPLPAGASDALAAEGQDLVRFLEDDAATYDVTVTPPSR